MRSDQLVLVNSPAKQSADKSNQIYSPKFKKLLESLKQMLERFQKKNFNSQESSNYSKFMVTATIHIIQILLDNNNKDYWSDKNNRKVFKELFDVLNFYKGTIVPDVFNTQSLQLATNLLESLRSIQQEIEQDTDSCFVAPQSKEIIISLLGEPAYFIQSLIDTLQCNINFYQAQIQHALFVKTATELKNSITEFFNYCQNNIIKIKPENFNMFLNEYSAVVKSLMSDINKLPYFIVKSLANITKQQEPNIFDSKEIEVFDCRRALICQLINEEYLLSVKMQSEQLPLLSIAYDVYQSRYIPQETQFITNKFTQLINECKSKAEIYIRGDHLGLLQSVDSKKVDLLNNVLMQVRILAESKDNDVGSKCLSIYRSCLEAARENTILSQNKNNPGEFSRVVNSIGLQFFAIVLNEISETNDVKVKQQFDIACELYQPPIIDVKNPEARILQKEIDRFLPDVINHLRCKKDYMRFPVCDQTIIALLQDPRCNGELIRNNANYFRKLLLPQRYERIVNTILVKPNKDKKINMQFWRNYLAVLSCDVMPDYLNNGQPVQTQLRQSPAKSELKQFVTSIDSPIKPSQQQQLVNVHGRCYAYIAELVNSNMTGFLTADTIISLLMLYKDQFGEIIDDQVSSKFDLFRELMSQFICQNYVFVHFVPYLLNILNTHIPRLINDYEKNEHILFLLLTFVADSNKSSFSTEQCANIYRLKKYFNDALTKKPEAVVHLLKRFGSQLTRRLEINKGTTGNSNYLIDQNHDVFANLLNNNNLCERALTPQDYYYLAHNLTLRQTIMFNVSYFDILLQYDQCLKILDYKEIEKLLGITKSHHSLSPASLIKLINLHTDLANFILNDASCMTKLLTSVEFNITLMRKYQDKIISYLTHNKNINIIEAFSADIYLKLLAAKIVLVKSILFANSKIALTTLAYKHNDAQFLAMYKNDIVKLLSDKIFCLNLNAAMLASLLSAFDKEELPAEFAQIAQHNPELIKSNGNQNLDQHWFLYEPLYTMQAKAGTLSKEQLIPLLQSLHPGCRLWLGDFYKAHSNNKNTLRLLLNDAEAKNIAQKFPFYRPILENEPVTQEDLEKFYVANSPEIDYALTAPINLLKTHKFLQSKFNAASKTNVCQRIQLFECLAYDKKFCINNINHLVKFFSEEGHTSEQVKISLHEFFNEAANLINGFLTACDINIINQNISLFLPALSNEHLQLDNDNLIKLSYCSHPAAHLYLCKNKERFEVVKKHLPNDANQLMMMLKLLIDNQCYHLLTNEKLVMNLARKVNELFNDFEHNSDILVALFKVADTRMLFTQLGPNELCKLLLINDDKFIHDVIATYRQSLIFLIAIQKIDLITATDSLVRTILLDRQLRDRFFNHAELTSALDINVFKNFIESYEITYVSWDKSKLGQECHKKLDIFCASIGARLIIERDIIKTMNNISYDFDRNVKVLTTLSNFSTDHQKRRRDLIAQITHSTSEMNYSFTNATFDCLNIRFEILICLFELLHYNGNEFNGKITEQVKQFCNELLGHKKSDDMSNATLLFRSLINKCLIQSYHPGVLSLVLSRRPDLIDVGIISADKRLANEFLFNPLLCQFLSAQSIAAIVSNDRALAISCFAYQHIFNVLDNHHDALISVAKLAGIVGNDDIDQIFLVMREISTSNSYESDLQRSISGMSVPSRANSGSHISPPVVQAFAKLNVFVERTASAPTLGGNAPPSEVPERRGSSDVVRPSKNLTPGSPSVT